MRIPELTDRMKHGPGQALRAVFAGIGQMFTAADPSEHSGQPADQAPAGPGPRTAMAFGGGPDGPAATRLPHGGRAGGAGPAAGASSGHDPGGAGQDGATRDSGAGHGGAGGRGRTGRAGKSDRSRRPGPSAADARWRSLDKTGNVRLLSAEDLALEFPDQATPPSPGSPASSPAVPPVPPVLTFTDASVADPAPAADATALDYPALDYASAPDYGVTAGAAAEAAVDADTAYETWTDIDVSALPDAAGDDLSAAAPAADTADTADIAETVNAADAATDPVGTAPDLAEAGDHGAGDLGAGGPTEAELPVPSYDSLSLPSLRARLRGLDVPQLRTLVDYERAHAARADVITMFERRIEKLSAGQ